MSRSPTPIPSGLQFTLELGRQAAVVTEVGAGLRRYTVDGRDVLDGYASDEMCSAAPGQTHTAAWELRPAL